MIHNKCIVHLTSVKKLCYHLNAYQSLPCLTSHRVSAHFGTSTLALVVRMACSNRPSFCFLKDA